MNEGLNDAYARIDKLDSRQKTTFLMVAGVGALTLIEGAGIFMAMKALQNLAKGLETVGEFAKNHAQATGFMPGGPSASPAPAPSPVPEAPRQNLQPRAATIPVDISDDLFTPPPEHARTVHQTFSARNGSGTTEVPAPVSNPVEGPASEIPDWAAQVLATETIDYKEGHDLT